MLSRKSKWRFRTNPSLVMSFYSLVIKKRESIKKQPRRVKKKSFLVEPHLQYQTGK